MRTRSWGWRLAAMAAAAMLALGLAACGDDDDSGDSGDTAGGDAEITLRLGYVTAPEHPYGIAIDNFVEEVTTASGGAIAIETLPNYQGGDVPLLQDARGGAVDIASVSSAVWGTQGVNCFDALQALGLITRYDLEREVITGSIGQEMLACTSSIGLQGLGIHEGGLRKPLGATKALNSPADFKGLAIRTPESSVLEEGIRALGADPTAIPFPDTYAALRDGTVDGMEANLGLIQTVKYYEVADFLTMNVNLWPFPTVLVMNQEKFDALTAEQQTAITDAAANIGGFSIDFFEAPSEIVQTLCDEGLKLSIASDADLAAMAKVSETVISQMSAADAQTGDFIQQIQAVKDGLPAPPAPAALPDGCAVPSTT
ncbi:MAG: TRAP transporter substrate-binding protein [Gemmatimonadales bacterium]